jgi:hypothetical protein
MRDLDSQLAIQKTSCVYHQITTFVLMRKNPTSRVQVSPEKEVDCISNFQLLKLNPQFVSNDNLCF